jgi:hypothetical protein
MLLFVTSTTTNPRGASPLLPSPPPRIVRLSCGVLLSRMVNVMLRGPDSAWPCLSQGVLRLCRSFALEHRRRRIGPIMQKLRLQVNKATIGYFGRDEGLTFA